MDDIMYLLGIIWRLLAIGNNLIDLISKIIKKIKKFKSHASTPEGRRGMCKGSIT